MFIIHAPDSRDPPDGPPYFTKKTFSPGLLGPTSYIFARKEVPDSRDPPGRSIHSIVILVANVYVHTIGLSAGYNDEAWLCKEGHM